MKPSPEPNSLDVDAIVEVLALEESGVGGPAAGTAATSTVVALKAELETLTERLRESPPPDEFEAESYCDRAIAAVELIGRDPSFSTREDLGTKDAGGLTDACALPEIAAIGQYKILSRLGIGGMGAVYKALHTKLEKVVALKVLPAERLKDTGAVARFEREMRAVGKLHHPNIVAAHDAGEVNGIHYLVMELVEGIDLGMLLKQRGSLPVPESCEIIRQAALGLQHAHEHGLVHRDIKPSNLMLAQGQGSRVKSQGSESSSPLTLDPHPLTVKVLDLGLALLDSSQRELVGELTSTGQIMGTLDYMAPEQGADTHAVDIRADVYSLGATLYKLLTGRAPFEGPQYNTPMKKLTALATAEPQRLNDLRSDVPRGLVDLVHQMLAKTPAQRPTPPAEVARLIARFTAGANLASLLAPSAAPVSAGVAVAETATAPTFIARTNVAHPDSRIRPNVTPPNTRTRRSHQEAPAMSTTDSRPRTSKARRSAASKTNRSCPPARRLRRQALIAVPLLFALGLIVIQRKQGTVTITTDDRFAEEVVVEVLFNDEVKVFNAKNHWTVHVRAGAYEVDLNETSNDEFHLKSNSLGVSRWGTTYLKIERQPATLSAGGEGSTVPHWRPTLAQQAFFDRVASLAPEQQVEAVRQELMRVNSGFDGTLDYEIADRQVVMLSWRSNVIDTIWPVRALSRLNTLRAVASDERKGAGRLKDLSPLHGLALREFSCQFTAVTDLSPLRGMPLAQLECGHTYVNDFSPLGGAPLTLLRCGVTDLDSLASLQGVLGSLTELNLNGTRVVDVTDLQHAKNLRILSLYNTAVSDISALRGLQLTELNCGLTPLQDLSPLNGMRSLRDLYIKQSGVTDLRHLSGLSLSLLSITPETASRNMSILRRMTTLGTINGQPAAEFLATLKLPPSEPAGAAQFALQFDGQDDYVDVPTLRYDGNHPITIEAWVTPSAAQEKLYSFVIDNVVETVTGAEYSVAGIALQQRSPGDARRGGDYWAAWVSTHRAPAGQNVIEAPQERWSISQATHLALQLNADRAQFYIDGRLIDARPLPDVHPASGREFLMGRRFAGTFNEVRVSRSVRYGEDFTPAVRFEPDEHTLALYHFDEGEGDILYDASGHGHDGKIFGAAWVRPDATLQPQLDGSGPYDPALERPIVEAVLQSGGNVSIVVPQTPANAGAIQSYAYGTNLAHELALLGQELSVRTIDELPAEPCHVTRVQLRRQAAIDPTLIESLARAPYLFELSLEGSAVTDGHAAVIGRMSQLRYLSVGLTGLTDEGLRELSRLSNLRYLSVWKAPGITDAGLEHIARLTNLVEIYLHGNPQLTDRGIALLRELPHVGWLWLEETGITDAALESVSGFEELDSLRLSRTKINGSGLAHLARLRKLNWLFLQDTEVTDEFGILLKDVAFGSLWLSGTSVGDATLEAIAGRQAIHQLILNGTGITDAGLAHLKGTRIVHLSANNTALTGSGLADLDIAEVLDLSGTQLSEDAAKSIARFNALKVLNVVNTPVSEESVQFLAGALPNCRIYSKFGTIEPGSAPASVGTAPRWSPTADQQSFLDAVAPLTAEEQESAVKEKLKAVNPGFDGLFELEIADGRIVRLSLKGNTQTVREIWPLAALTGLTELLLGEAPVADLSPVARLTELRLLSCYRTAITDIAPVSTLKKLDVFDCRETLVRDLTPLAGLPLKELRTFAVSPYNEPFRQLAATWPQLKTINDIPIAEFLARRDDVEQLRKKLPAFPPDKQLDLVVEKVKEFNPGWNGELTHVIVNDNEIHVTLAAPHRVWDLSPLHALRSLKGLTCNGNEQLADLSPLAGLELDTLFCHASAIVDLSPLRGMPIKSLICGDNPIDDLSPLATMPLTRLLCDNSPVFDLSPIAGSPLEHLSFSSTRVNDLSPLLGMPLKYVECSTTRVTSLEPLRGMQLTFLGCGQCEISDFSPLVGMPLKELRCPATQVSDFSPLVGMPLAKLQAGSNRGLTDLSVLAGMPLTELECRFSAASDYAPLTGMPIDRISIDFHLLGTHDEVVLRSLPNVTEINSLPAADFWRKIEQRRREAAEWSEALSALPGEQQLARVRTQLTELHAAYEYVPSFALEPVYAEGHLVELSIVVNSGDLADLRPLCGLTHLKKLSLTGHLPHVRDLSPLYALEIEELHIGSDVILRSNLVGLRSMPKLRTINGQPAADFLATLKRPPSEPGGAAQFALQFDGQDDYVDVPTLPAMGVETETHGRRGFPRVARRRVNT